MKFGYTILYVQDVAKTLSFYEAAFGVKQKFFHESGYGELDTGETKLAFASFEIAKSHGFDFKPMGLDTPVPSFEVAFVTPNVESSYQNAVRAGATEVKKPESKPWGQVVGYVRDLNGYLVEICSPVA